MLLPLLVACATPDAPKTETAPPVTQEPACQPADTPTETALAWDDPGPGGHAAADVLGFAVGTLTGRLTWDDGVEEGVTLEVTPGAVSQTITGPQESCPVGVTAQVTWALDGADGRVHAGGSAVWSVADAAWPPAGVSVSATLDRAAQGLTPLAPSSTLYLRAYVQSDGTLASVVVEEVWPLGMDQNRVCVRASLDPAALSCHDTGESTGPD